jgi:hypothetical protein
MRKKAVKLMAAVTVTGGSPIQRNTGLPLNNLTLGAITDAYELHMCQMHMVCI